MSLSVKEISKTYSNGVHALNNLNLTIDNGMFGLLGPNGAGKSSLMRSLATLQSVDQGSIFLDDIDLINSPQLVREKLGYLPQEFGLYPMLTAFDLLDHYARLKGLSNKKTRQKEVLNLLEQTNLYEKRNEKLKTFSGGMKRRFGIAQALLANPRLIIVDEPTAGLDPTERARFHNLLAQVGNEAIVILSTHIVEDISNLCPEVAILNKGQIVHRSSTVDALKRLDGKVWAATIDKPTLEKVTKDYQLLYEQVFNGRINVRVEGEKPPSHDFELAKPTLDDVYFSLCKSEAK